jgi:hypothetical protein
MNVSGGALMGASAFKGVPLGALLDASGEALLSASDGSALLGVVMGVSVGEALLVVLLGAVVNSRSVLEPREEV